MTTLVLLMLLGQAPDGGGEPASVVEPRGAEVHEVSPKPSVLQEFTVAPVIDVIGAFGVLAPTGTAASDVFSLPRAQLGIESAWRGAMARAVVEGVFSTQGGALVGVAGDSFLLRFQEAWAGYRWHWLDARLGLVTSPLVAGLDRVFPREVAPEPLLQHGLVPLSDFGASVRARLPGRFGWVALTASNGEGFAQRELNATKNVEATAFVHPLPSGALEPLTLLGSAILGTVGIAGAKANRFGGGAMWGTPTFTAGATGFALDGLEADSGRHGVLAQAFARAEFFERLLASVRVQQLWRNVSADDRALQFSAGVGVRLSVVDLFAVVQYDGLSSVAREALPGVDGVQFRVTARIHTQSILEAP